MSGYYFKIQTKLDALCSLINKKVKEYSQSDSVSPSKQPKVVFLGLNMTPNGIPHFINWDIIYMVNYLNKQGIESRLHDPHIKGSEALSQGLWLGRHDGNDNWTHEFDAMILSCPHLFYMQNIGKLANLVNPNKLGALIDLYGAFQKLYKVGDSIDILNFSKATKKAELLGGFNLVLPPGRQIEDTK